MSTLIWWLSLSYEERYLRHTAGKWFGSSTPIDYNVRQLANQSNQTEASKISSAVTQGVGLTSTTFLGSLMSYPFLYASIRESFMSEDSSHFCTRCSLNSAKLFSFLENISPSLQLFFQSFVLNNTEKTDYSQTMSKVESIIDEFGLDSSFNPYFIYKESAKIYLDCTKEAFFNPQTTASLLLCKIINYFSSVSNTIKTVLNRQEVASGLIISAIACSAYYYIGLQDRNKRAQTEVQFVLEDRLNRIYNTLKQKREYCFKDNEKIAELKSLVEGIVSNPYLLVDDIQRLNLHYVDYSWIEKHVHPIVQLARDIHQKLPAQV